MKRFFLLLPLLAVLTASAETAFVSDKLSVPLKSAAGESGAPVKQLESGTPLEVIAREGLWAHVRDRSGADGWVEVRFITNEAPARAQLTDAQAQLGKLRTQLGETQALLKKTEIALVQESARVKELQKTTAPATAAMPPPAEPVPPPVAAEPKPAPPAAETPSAGAELMSTTAWLVTCFAMLVIGFLGGNWWLKESIRRRSGGMYLRV
jgi:hypothetical protein